MNDITEAVEQVKIIQEFADDTEVGQIMVMNKNREKLQQALDSLCRWAERWSMGFNIPKCKVMHLGNHNPQHENVKSGQWQTTTSGEKDIDLTRSSNLKPSTQCAKRPEWLSQFLAR